MHQPVDDLTPGERIEYLLLLCQEAKAMSRRGLMGTLSAEYAEVHGEINAELVALGV